MVVNGTAEQDWDAVLKLAGNHLVIPSLGLHPWFLANRSSHWEETLIGLLDQRPCAIGEIGLDRWMANPDIDTQRDVFIRQLKIASDRNLPVTIHCLKAWGPLLEILQTEKMPSCGFLLHSYGGSAEMVPQFLKLGGFFSISGHFAHGRKLNQREVFRTIPLDRLLIETDAPDMLPPEKLQSDRLPENVNSPLNIQSIYRFAANLFEKNAQAFSDQVTENFNRLFVGLLN